jgi:hypothetical protein
MHELNSLVHDTLTYLQDPLLPKQVIFATAEEWPLFQRKNARKSLPSLQEKVSPTLPKKFAEPTTHLNSSKAKEISDEIAPISPKGITEPISEKKQEQEIVDSDRIKPKLSGNHLIKDKLQRIVPHIKLVEQIPDDAEAKRIASGWKEKMDGVKVVLLACSPEQDNVELLKILAKAIDQNLAKSKVIAAERLEREKRWDLFFEKNSFQLILASQGMQNFPELMRFYQAFPSQDRFLLGSILLLPLSAPSFYQSPEHKSLLWKKLCQILKT